MGGRLGNVFDEDPKRWRMVAEAFLTVGLALEIATAFSPANFIVLAGAGNLSRAVGRGMTNPCFRIIQTHFAAASNVGDVAAKEEVCNMPCANFTPALGFLRGILFTSVSYRLYLAFSVPLVISSTCADYFGVSC